MRTVALIGAGMLGGAMARCWLQTGALAPQQLTIVTRSGKAKGFAPWPDIATTTHLAQAAQSDIIVLAVPPAALPEMTLCAPNSLILSVMAGARTEDITARTGSARVIRAMSSPAAEHRRAFTPWIATDACSASDRQAAQRLFSAMGQAEPVPSEDMLDHFTAMTGPVPGFVAFFAQAMIEHATDAGIPPDIADRAIRQLFLASGEMLAQDPMTAQDHVRQMVDYAGTTAAGLLALQGSTVTRDISDALTIAAQRARGMRPGGV